MPDTLIVGLEALLADAREHPHRYRMSAETRQQHQEQWITLRKYGCDGPVVEAIARALRLDEEARRAQR